MLRLKELREGRAPRLSQEGLARAAGLSVKTVRRAEASGNANARTLQALARALGVHVGDLFDEEGAA